MNNSQTVSEEVESRYVSESDWNAPSESDLKDYLTGNLLTERPN